MLRYEAGTDFNGLVIFEPTRLVASFGVCIEENTDLFTLFTTTDKGDMVLREGIVVPILAITDAGYTVEFYIDESSKRPASCIKFENGVFPLKVDERLVLADLIVFKEWSWDTDWIDVDVPPGVYAATVRGFTEYDKNGHIEDAGYEILLRSCDTLPELTGATDVNSQVLS